jgi:hypothetical protein
VLFTGGGLEFSPRLHGQLAEFAHHLGSWLGPAVDYEEPGFQTSAGGPVGLQRTLALGSSWGLYACVELGRKVSGNWDLTIQRFTVLMTMLCLI